MKLFADIKFILDLGYELVKEFAKIGTIFIAGTSFGFVKNVMRLRKFKRVFGSIAAVDDRFIICLPLWKAIESSRDIARFSKIGLDNKTYTYYGPSDTISFHDNEAANELSVLYNSIFNKPTKIIIDNEQIELNNTIMFIGSPIANIRLKSYLDVHTNKYLEFIQQEENEIHKSAIGIFDKINNCTYDSGKNIEYSVVMRSKNPQCENGYFYIIGGAHAEGTLAASRYVRLNWKDFADYDDDFAIVLEMPRSNATFSKVKVCYGCA